MTRNIWSTPECDAWSRDFSYKEYLELHRQSGCTGAVASEEMYDELCGVFDNDLAKGIYE